MRRTIVTLAAVLAATAATAQESIHPKKIVDPEAGLPLYKRTVMPPWDPIGDVPPGWSLSAQSIVMPPSLANLKPEPVVMNGGMGGLISGHMSRFSALATRGVPVEMHGGCWSACTLITGYIRKDQLCFGAGSFLAFHAAQTAEHKLSMNDTWTMYWILPVQIRDWLDANGGPLKMTVNNYWFLRDVDLWKMGWPRCK